MSLPIDPRTPDQAELERRYRESVPAYPGRDAPAAQLGAHDAAHIAAADAFLLCSDDTAHQASRARVGLARLDTSDDAARARAVHRADERGTKRNKKRRQLEAASPTDRDGLTPEATLIVTEHAAGILHAAQTLCAAVDAAAVELTQGRRRGSGLKRIRRALKSRGGRPRGAGPGTPVDAPRALLRAGMGVRS